MNTNDKLQQALNNPPKLFHKPHTDEAKEKIRLSKLGKKRTEAWDEYVKTIHKIMETHNITYRHAQKVYKVYEEQGQLECFQKTIENQIN